MNSNIYKIKWWGNLYFLEHSLASRNTSSAYNFNKKKPNNNSPIKYSITIILYVPQMKSRALLQINAFEMTE